MYIRIWLKVLLKEIAQIEVTSNFFRNGTHYHLVAELVSNCATFKSMAVFIVYSPEDGQLTCLSESACETQFFKIYF